MTSLLSSIGQAIVITAIGLSSLLGYDLPQTQDQYLGAIQGAADFRTSLSSGISAADTTMTLISTSTPSGENLIQGKSYGFKLGGQEYVIGTLSAGKQITSMTRGVSQITGTSTGATAKAWGRGTAVEITDAPILLEISSKISGLQDFDNVIRYSSSVATTTIDDSDQNLVNVELLNYVAFDSAGVVAGSESVAGYLELSTGLETASSTSSGSSGRLAIPASLATSTYNSATADLKVVVTDNSGKIDDGFLTAAAPIGSITAYASTTAPTGWLLANGSAISRTTYSGLFAVLGTSYGVGDGSTTFNLPDLMGRTIVMASTTQTATSTYSRASLGDTGGSTTHTQTANELAAHTHNVNTNDGTGSGVSVGESDSGSAGTFPTASTGNNIAFNILDPYIILNYIIKY